MGGVDERSLFGINEHFLQPDYAAVNLKSDPIASAYVFQRCQELSVGLVVITRPAAEVVSVPSFFYDELAALGHPLALYLRAHLVKTIRCVLR